MDIEKRDAIRMIVSGQKEKPITLTTDPMTEDQLVDTGDAVSYNETNKGSNMTQEHTHDGVDYKEMAGFLQNRIGELHKVHEIDLYFLQRQVVILQQQVQELQKGEQLDVVD